MRASVVVAPGLESTGSVVVVHRLSCPAACGVSLDQGSNLRLLHWQADSLPLEPLGKPYIKKSPYFQGRNSPRWSEEAGKEQTLYQSPFSMY